jgi:hypothetical protein
MPNRRNCHILAVIRPNFMIFFPFDPILAMFYPSAYKLWQYKKFQDGCHKMAATKWPPNNEKWSYLCHFSSEFDDSFSPKLDF